MFCTPDLLIGRVLPGSPIRAFEISCRDRLLLLRGRMGPAVYDFRDGVAKAVYKGRPLAELILNRDGGFAYIAADGSAVYSAVRMDGCS